MSTEAALIAEINSTISRIEGKVQELTDSVNSGLSKIPSWAGWIADRVMDGWNWFVDKMNEFWSWLSTIVQNMGSPESLTTTADAWSDQVGAPVSEEVANAEAGSLLVDDSWSGDAADQYTQRLSLQKNALDRVRFTFTDGIGTALKDVATAIHVWWGALVAAMAALVVGIIGAIASSATIFGLPAAPFIAAGAVGVCLAALWGGGEILKSATAGANTLLRQKLSDSSAYPDGRWPAGVAR